MRVNSGSLQVASMVPASGTVSMEARFLARASAVDAESRPVPVTRAVPRVAIAADPAQSVSRSRWGGDALLPREPVDVRSRSGDSGAPRNDKQGVPVARENDRSQDAADDDDEADEAIAAPGVPLVAVATSETVVRLESSHPRSSFHAAAGDVAEGVAQTGDVSTRSGISSADRAAGAAAVREPNDSPAGPVDPFAVPGKPASGTAIDGARGIDMASVAAQAALPGNVHDSARRLSRTEQATGDDVREASAGRDRAGDVSAAVDDADDASSTATLPDRDLPARFHREAEPQLLARAGEPMAPPWDSRPRPTIAVATPTDSAADAAASIPSAADGPDTGTTRLTYNFRTWSPSDAVDLTLSRGATGEARVMMEPSTVRVWQALQPEAAAGGIGDWRMLARCDPDAQRRSHPEPADDDADEDAG